jgi:lysophospholipase L1-like esterase
MMVHMARRFRPWLMGLTLLALLAIACKQPVSEEGPGTGEPPPPSVDGIPSSMVALGDSITAAYGSCLAPTACPRNSWATGDGTQVISHYRRIVAINPAMKGHGTNLAKPGASSADLPGQAAAAVAVPVGYVTVLVGANDACKGEMTPAGTFRARVGEALATIVNGMPDAQVLVVSIPDVYRVWEIGHTNRVALATWRSGACPNLLSNPESFEPADVARRQTFANQIAAYNAELGGACADAGPRCRYVDVSGFAFELTMLSAIDFFHPNASGQQALADATYGIS